MLRTFIRRRFALALGFGLLIVAVRGVSAVQGQPAQLPTEVITANRFSLSIDGYDIGNFSEVLSISAEIESPERSETSGEEARVNKLSSKLKLATVTLRRGMSSSLQLWAWHEAVRKGSIATARRSGSLTLFNAEGKPVAKYSLEKAWPSKVELSADKAGASQALLETVTLTCENIRRVAP